MPDKNTEKSGLPVVFNIAQKSMAEIKTLPDAVKANKFIRGLIKAIEGQDMAFDDSFKASEILIQSHEKIWGFISKPKLRDSEVAKAINKTKPALHQWRSEHKRAFAGKTQSDMEALKKKAYENSRLLSLDWFIKGGFVGNSGDDEYYTPDYIVEASRQALGGQIDLDPASCEMAQKTVRAKKYYTEEDNGLTKEWSGNVFLNPPFSMLKAFSKKLISSGESLTRAIFIGRMDVGTEWGQAMLLNSNAFCVPKNRIPFYKEDGIPAKQNNMANIIFGFKINTFDFHSAFEPIGQVINKQHPYPYISEEYTPPPEDIRISKDKISPGLMPKKLVFSKELKKP